ncbi:MAG: branched-chain amino acid transport system II carrier protein, partial [Eubacteriales bacterium]|nr:branched-chain amino acid transport system II carrier protein [Eubacteriales bacterium]
NPLLVGCVEGYGTMDAIAGLAFGIVIINIIRSMGVTKDHDVAREVLFSGILTGILMAAIYAATIIMGVQSRGLFEVSENGGIALAQIADHYLGFAGSIILAITIIFACLKTSIGLVTSCSEAFSRMFPTLFSYRIWAIIFSVFSFVVSNVGLSKIIEYAVPLLMFLYPLTITLTLLALFEKLFGASQAVYVSVTAFTGIAALFDLCNALPEFLQKTLHTEVLIGFAKHYLPMYGQGLGCALPALLGLVLGLAIYFGKRNTQRK